MARLAVLVVILALAACAVGEPGTPGSFTPTAGGRAAFYGAMSLGR